MIIVDQSDGMISCHHVILHVGVVWANVMCCWLGSKQFSNGALFIMIETITSIRWMCYSFILRVYIYREIPAFSEIIINTLARMRPLYAKCKSYTCTNTHICCAVCYYGLCTKCAPIHAHQIANARTTSLVLQHLVCTSLLDWLVTK